MIYAAIAEAKKRVLNELSGKKCEYKMKPRIDDKFAELQKKAEECNNVAKLQSIKFEADTLKVRLLNTIESEEQAMNPPVDDGGDGTMHGDKPMPFKKQKTISIKSINTSTTWQLETVEDVKSISVNCVAN